MVKSQNHNTRAVLAVIFMLAASPLAVTYSHAEVSDENDEEISKSVEMTWKVRHFHRELLHVSKLQLAVMLLA